jgi:hypothetical protein
LFTQLLKQAHLLLRLEELQPNRKTFVQVVYQLWKATCIFY